MCNPIRSFVAYAGDYCLNGPFLQRSDSANSPAAYAGLRVDGCAAETCVEVNRDAIFSAGQIRTAQALVHQTDLFLNGSSADTGNLGLSRSLVTTASARDAALARLDRYERTHQLPHSCSETNVCEALNLAQINALRESLESETTPLSTKIVGTASAALSGVYLVHLFHALKASGKGIPFLTSLGRVVANDIAGAARPGISTLGRGITLLATASRAGQLAVAIPAGIALGAAIHYSGLGHYIGTDWLGEHLGNWLAS
ncbi:MAG: hypothetical protein HQM15_05080 [Deltaproteobacteria bacterium]|nr:hypothetical protein [Deltaproteobacteria bacterium]